MMFEESPARSQDSGEKTESKSKTPASVASSSLAPAKEKKEKKSKKEKKAKKEKKKEKAAAAAAAGSSNSSTAVDKQQPAGEYLDESGRPRMDGQVMVQQQRMMGGPSLLEDDEDDDRQNWHRQSVHDVVGQPQQQQQQQQSDPLQMNGPGEDLFANFPGASKTDDSFPGSMVSGSQMMAKPVQAHVELDDAQSFGGFIIDETRRQDMGIYQKETQRRASMGGGPGMMMMGVNHATGSPPPQAMMELTGGGLTGGSSHSGTGSGRSRHSQPISHHSSNDATRVSGDTPLTRGQGGYSTTSHGNSGRPMDTGRSPYGPDSRGNYSLGPDGQHYPQQQDYYGPTQQQMATAAQGQYAQHHQYEQQQEQTGEYINDSCTIHSDITGLTGAFSNMPPNGRVVVEEDLTDEEPDVPPLAYPRQRLVPLRTESELRAARQAKWQQRGPLRVSFATVEVRHYERIIGDNPSTVSGPPISIGWRYRQADAISVDEWETQQHSLKGYLRSNELILNREERETMLVELGYSQKDIAAAVRSGIRDKNRRRRTVQNLKSQGMEEAMEKARGGVKNFFRVGKKQ